MIEPDHVYQQSEDLVEAAAWSIDVAADTNTRKRKQAAATHTLLEPQFPSFERLPPTNICAPLYVQAC